MRESMLRKIRNLSLLLLAVPMLSFAQGSDLESRIEALEERALLDVFSFSGNLKYYFDNIVTDDGTNKKEARWQRMSFALNTTAKPYENINVYATLRMSKYVNAIYGDNIDGGDLSGSRAYAGSEVYIEKAYADYIVNDSFVFSFGRLPTIDGVPANYMYGKPVMGTYPMMAYASILDGLAFTYKPSNQLAARFVYTPFSAVPKSKTEYVTSQTGVACTNNPNTTDCRVGSTVSSVTDTSNSDLYALMLDYNNTDFGFARNFNAILQFITIPETNAAKASGISALGTLTNKYDFLTLHFEAADLANTGLNVSVSHLITKAKIEGTALAQIGGTAADNSGAGTLLALSYRAFGNSVLGLEVIKSNKEYMNYSRTNEFLGEQQSFASTVGTGVHAYYTHSFKPTFTGTLGYINQKITHSNWSTLIGAQPASEYTDPLKVGTVYARLNLDF